MLSLDLETLSPGAHHLLTNRDTRAAVTELILGANLGGTLSDVAAIQQTDAAVSELLAAVGLPRGVHVRGPIVDTVGRGWAGRKVPDCRLMIDRAAFLDLPADDRPDALLKTWLHESLHGRQPYASGFASEWRDLRGFEEGMVEGLARFISVDMLGLAPVLASYNYYVDAYRALAQVLDIPVVDLWQELWMMSAGVVADGFLRTLEDILRSHARAPLALQQRARLLAQARSAFGSRNTTREPDVATLEVGWRRAVE